MKDYYVILEVSEQASAQEIRKAYRGLAFKYHPDRSPGNIGAEERFKEVAEAYGVLIDPEKRAQYDRLRRLGPQGTETGAEFRYSQEEILQHVFRDPRFGGIFHELFKEFEKAGLRGDQRFFDQTFFGGRGILFGGVFVWDPFRAARSRVEKRPRPESPPIERHDAPALEPLGILKRLGRKIGRFLLGAGESLPQVENEQAAGPCDLAYHLTVGPEEARRGTWVKVAVDRNGGRETIRVKVPPGTRSGARLRVKGKGNRHDSGTGDLYLTIHLA